MTTELCAYTCDACDIARRTGVTRIELCAAPLEGGTTPSAGLIRYARSLPDLRLSVMIRPRGGDFLYTDDEVALMAEEIRLAREYGADGVVFGLLTPAGEVDETRPAQLVREIRQSRGRDAYILMLSHRNDELDLWANMGVQTVLCGHGHGGIVRLPFVGAVFGTHLDLFPDYTAGLYRKGQTSMIVSRGLGGSRKLPLRIGNRPEIVTVILKAESGKV